MAQKFYCPDCKTVHAAPATASTAGAHTGLYVDPQMADEFALIDAAFVAKPSSSGQYAYQPAPTLEAATQEDVIFKIKAYASTHRPVDNSAGVSVYQGNFNTNFLGAKTPTVYNDGWGVDWIITIVNKTARRKNIANTIRSGLPFKLPPKR